MRLACSYLQKFLDGSISVEKNGRIRQLRTCVTWLCNTATIRLFSCGAFASTKVSTTMHSIPERTQWPMSLTRHELPQEYATLSKATFLKTCIHTMTSAIRVRMQVHFTKIKLPIRRRATWSPNTTDICSLQRHSTPKLTAPNMP